MISRINALFVPRYRGFRVIELAAATCLVVLALGVYCSKAFAGAEGAKIATTTREIDEEARQVRLLNAELSYLQQPGRLERLSEAYDRLGPVPAQHEVTPEALAVLARKPVPLTRVATTSVAAVSAQVSPQ